MLRFISKKIFFETIPTLLVIVTITFFMVRLAPGGPFSQEKNVPPQILKNLNEHYGLNDPLPVQYFEYLKQLVKGNLGPSFKYPNRTVSELIGDAFPVSLELGFYALLFAMVVGLPAGIFAALNHNTVGDYVPMALAMVGICVPTFVLGPLLGLEFAIKLGWFNVSGWALPGDRVLPAITLGSPVAAYIARLCRGGMLEILNQDFIRTARAKGLTETRVVFRHALKGGLIPVISFLGPAVAGLITGSIIVETIFHIPGLGRFFVNSAFNRDYTMLQGTVLFYATLIILFNTFVDIMLAWMNPRMRLNE